MNQLPDLKEINSFQNHRRAIDRIFDSVDKALWAGHNDGKWPAIDRWLRSLPPEDLTTYVVVAILSITLPIKQTHARTKWAEQATKVIQEREGERTDRLLQGLI